jgi:hypothetical protein
MRYRARYVGPDGTEKSKSFLDKQRRLADAWLINIEADTARGQYIDPRAARVTFREYADRWLGALTTDLTSRAAVEGRLRLHALPYLGPRPIGSFQPAHIRDWNRRLEDAVASAQYRRLIFDAVSSVLNAAVDDRLLASNPCRARSVKAPRPAPSRVHPWTAEQVFGVQWDVPLDPEGSAALREHMTAFPPVDVTMPWLTPTGLKVTHRLLFTSGIGAFSDQAWKPALASAGIIPTSRKGRALRTGPRARHARPTPLLRLGPPRRRGEHQSPEPLPRPQRPGLHTSGLHPPHAVQRDPHPESHLRNVPGCRSRS